MPAAASGVTLTPSIVPSGRVGKPVLLDLALVELANLARSLFERGDKGRIEASSAASICSLRQTEALAAQHRQNAGSNRAPRHRRWQRTLATISRAASTMFCGSTPLCG